MPLCTYFSGNEPHKQKGMGRVVISWDLDGVMVSTLAWNTRDMGPIPARGVIFPIFITSTKVTTNIQVLFTKAEIPLVRMTKVNGTTKIKNMELV